MTRRFVLVEGPDDVAALQEIGKRLYNARAGGIAGGPGRAERASTLAVGATTIELRAALNAKDGIAAAMGAWLESLAPQVEGDETRHDRVAFVFDPDGDAPDAFVNKVDRVLTALPTWSVVHRAEGATWRLTRADEPPIELCGVAWNASGPPFDGLADHQNLERILCRVLGSAYAEWAPIVAGWLDTIRDKRGAGKALKWKAAVLLWAACVDEGTTGDAGITSRFLGQHKFPGGDGFQRYVLPELEASGMRSALDWIFT
jgi:hypothetical protein